MGKRWQQWQILFLGGSIIIPDDNGNHEIKRHLLFPWKKSYEQPKKLRHHFAKKGPYSQATVLPVVMYGCETWTIKKAEHWRIDVFKLWCWRRLLRVPWTARRSNRSILKEVSPKNPLEGLMLKLKPNTLATWIDDELTNWKRSSCWESLKALVEWNKRGWDVCMVSVTQWTWV